MGLTKARAYDYVAIGHVTVDVLVDPDGDERRQPGGGAFYSGLQAARLGLRTLLITRGNPDELQLLLGPYAKELDLAVTPAAQTTTLETRGAGHERRQRLCAWAGPILPADAQAAMRAPGTLVTHLAPIAREMPAQWPSDRISVGLLCLTPQGLVRHWAHDGEIHNCPVDTAALPRHIDAAVISTAERVSCKPLLGRVPVIAVTAGEGPTTIALDGKNVSQIAPAPVNGAHDDLGAGDVFAAAFFVAIAEGLTPLQAARRGNAAAAVRISCQGPDAIGDRYAIERQLG